ncbi:MAG TPA: hypothetical protein VGF89_08850 [Steroidobacteraceae bacterium]|jgi:hypothetical protein
MRLRVSHRWGLISAAIALLTATPAMAASDGLQVYDNPGGGQVVYGPVDASTPQAAMAAVLHYAHTRFGDTPVVGKAFQSRDGQNFGAFFTLTAKSQGNQRLAGLAIVSLARGAKPAAAVLYDQSSRFAKTEPALLQALNQAWKTASTRPASGAAGAVPPLTPTPFPDGSGSVSLPAGWRVAFASHGAAKIEGPKGESVLLMNSYGPIYDPGNPQVQARMRYANPNNPPLLCPDTDALHTYLCLLQRSRPPPSFQLQKSQPLPPQRMAVQAMLVDADLDMHDGRGVLACELGLSITAMSPTAGRTLGINGTCAPKSSMPQELPTLKAVFDSYSMNGQVVANQYAADAHRSQQAGANARAQANAAHAAEDAQSAAFQAHMDNIDRFSKSFQNYQLDQTELQDNNQNARGAVPNSLADALIKADPDRFQAVPTQDFLKGVDF